MTTPAVATLAALLGAGDGVPAAVARHLDAPGWDAVLSVAGPRDLMPALWRPARTLGLVEPVPEPLVEALGDQSAPRHHPAAVLELAYRRNAARTQDLLDQLEAVVDDFAAARDRGGGPQGCGPPGGWHVARPGRAGHVGPRPAHRPRRRTRRPCPARTPRLRARGASGRGGRRAPPSAPDASPPPVRVHRAARRAPATGMAPRARRSVAVDRRSGRVLARPADRRAVARPRRRHLPGARLPGRSGPLPGPDPTADGARAVAVRSAHGADRLAAGEGPAGAHRVVLAGR